VSAEPSIGIVGGGVMGLSLARSLARRGHEVTLRSAVGLGAGGASEAPAALLNPYRGRTGRPHPDDLLALAVVARWDAELRAEGLDPGVAWSGVVRVADGARQARAFAAVAGLAPFPAGAAPAPYRAPHGGAVAVGEEWVAPR
jgi:glycine/D-amino acid oxidase-like deaminating enzyme